MAQNIKPRQDFINIAKTWKSAMRRTKLDHSQNNKSLFCDTCTHACIQAMGVKKKGFTPSVAPLPIHITITVLLWTNHKHLCNINETGNDNWCLQQQMQLVCVLFYFWLCWQTWKKIGKPTQHISLCLHLHYAFVYVYILLCVYVYCKCVKGWKDKCRTLMPYKRTTVYKQTRLLLADYLICVLTCTTTGLN